MEIEPSSYQLLAIGKDPENGQQFLRKANFQRSRPSVTTSGDGWSAQVNLVTQVIAIDWVRNRWTHNMRQKVNYVTIFGIVV